MLVLPKGNEKLEAVYGANSPAEIARLYDDWADRYEADMVTAGYRHPSICLALFSRYVPRGSAPVLDAGAGTGLVGEWLAIVGYKEVEALDISSRMLAVAAQKQVYTALHEAALGTDLPFQDGYFAGIVSAGVFTTGHVGREGLGELIRICRSGGAIVLTVKRPLWETELSREIDMLVDQRSLRVLEKTDFYVSMPGNSDTVPSLAVALEVVR